MRRPLQRSVRTFWRVPDSALRDAPLFPVGGVTGGRRGSDGTCLGCQAAGQHFHSVWDSRPAEQVDPRQFTAHVDGAPAVPVGGGAARNDEGVPGVLEMPADRLDLAQDLRAASSSTGTATWKRASPRSCAAVACPTGDLAYASCACALLPRGRLLLRTPLPRRGRLLLFRLEKTHVSP